MDKMNKKKKINKDEQMEENKIINPSRMNRGLFRFHSDYYSKVNSFTIHFEMMHAIIASLVAINQMPLVKAH